MLKNRRNRKKEIRIGKRTRKRKGRGKEEKGRKGKKENKFNEMGGIIFR